MSARTDAYHEMLKRISGIVSIARDDCMPCDCENPDRMSGCRCLQDAFLIANIVLNTEFEKIP